MSVISMLVIQAERLPSMAQMRQSIALSGDPLELTHDVDLRDHTGYLPVRVHGRNTGFEYYFDELEPGDVPDEAEGYGSHAMTTRIGGDFEEARAAFLFLRVAARLTDGAYVDDDGVTPPDGVDAHLAEQITACDQLLR